MSNDPQAIQLELNNKLIARYDTMAELHSRGDLPESYLSEYNDLSNNDIIKSHLNNKPEYDLQTIAQDIMSIDVDTTSADDMDMMGRVFTKAFAEKNDMIYSETNPYHSFFGQPMEARDVIIRLQKRLDPSLHTDRSFTAYEHYNKLDDEGKLEQLRNNFKTLPSYKELPDSVTNPVVDVNSSPNIYGMGGVMISTGQTRRKLDYDDFSESQKAKFKADYERQLRNLNFLAVKKHLDNALTPTSKEFIQDYLDNGEVNDDLLSLLGHKDVEQVAQYMDYIRLTDDAGVAEEAVRRFGSASFSMVDDTIDVTDNLPRRIGAGLMRMITPDDSAINNYFEWKQRVWKSESKTEYFKDKIASSKYEDRGWFGKGITGLSESAPYMIATIFTGGSNLAVSTTAKIGVIASQYKQAKDFMVHELGVEDDFQTNMIALATSAVNYGLERLQVGQVGDNVLKREFSTLFVKKLSQKITSNKILTNAIRLGENISLEMIEEVSQGVVSEIGNQMAVGKADMDALVDSISATFKEANSSVILMSVFGMAGGHVANHYKGKSVMDIEGADNASASAVAKFNKFLKTEDIRVSETLSTKIDNTIDTVDMTGAKQAEFAEYIKTLEPADKRAFIRGEYVGEIEIETDVNTDEIADVKTDKNTDEIADIKTDVKTFSRSVQNKVREKIVNTIKSDTDYSAYINPNIEFANQPDLIDTEKKPTFREILARDMTDAVKYIRQRVGLEDRGRLITQLKRIASSGERGRQARLDELITKVDEVVYKSDHKRAVNNLTSTIKTINKQIKKARASQGKSNRELEQNRQLQDLIKSTASVSFKNSSLEYLQNTLQEIKTLAKTGRDLRKERYESNKAKMNGWVEEALEINPTPSKGGVFDDTKKSIWTNTMDKIKNLSWSVVTPANIMKALGNMEDDNIYSRVMTDAIDDALADKMRGEQYILEKFMEIHGKDLASFNEKTITIDGHEMTYNQAMAIYGYSKNTTGKQHLLLTRLDNETLITEEFINDVIEALPTENKNMVDQLISINDNYMYPRVNNVFNRSHHVDMVKEENYLMIKNLDKSDQFGNVNHTDILDHLKHEGKGSGKKINDSITKARSKKVDTGFKTLDYVDSAITGLLQAENYVSMSYAISQAHRFWNDNRIKNSVGNRTSDSLHNMINDYLKAVAEADALPSTSMDKLFAGLRKNTVVAYLGFNIGTVIKQVPSYFTGLRTMTRGTDKNIFVEGITGLVDFMKNPNEAVKLARSKSIKMAERVNASNRDLAEIKKNNRLTNLKGVDKAERARLIKMRDVVLEAQMGMITTADTVATSALWVRQYKSAIADGVSDTDAIKLADKIIDTTQPASNPVHMSAMLSSKNQILRAFTMFMSQPSQNLNLFINSVRRFATSDAGIINKSTDFAIDMITEQWVPMTLIYIINKGVLGVGDDDAEEEFADYAKHMIDSAFMGIPIVSNIAKAMSSRLLFNKNDRPSYEAELTPPALSGIKDLMTGLIKSKDWVALRGVLTTMGVPTNAINRIIKSYQTESVAPLLLPAPAIRDIED